MFRKLYHTIFVDTFNRFHPGEKINQKVFLSLILSAFCLVTIYYLGSIQKLIEFLNSIGLSSLAVLAIKKLNAVKDFQLLDLCYWAFCSFFFYFLVPIIVIKYIFKESTLTYGLSMKNLTKSFKIYGYFLLIMLPLIYLASHTKQFQDSYPFYRMDYMNSSKNHLIIWEIFYFLQFIGLEFFFRGFMVHSLKKQFGFYSIFIMMIPYCMIHFGKPWPETLGAIVAGIILGSMSLKSNSIWLGVLLHFSVAIAMDCFSLLNR